MPTVVCPNPTCRHQVSVPEDMGGKTVRCPECTTEIIVPGVKDSTMATPIGPGLRFAHYEIISCIGRGGMGDVYKARNLRLDKVVALKMLSEALAGRDPRFVERFLREAQSGARLDHPNVVPIYFVGAAGDQYFIEMQYIEGTTLDDLIKGGGRPDILRMSRIIREAARGIAAAHAMNIVHRDVKPANIMIDAKGNVKVTDFGLAKLVEGSTDVTASGQIMGTPHYMSPEQCAGRPADARSDIYSLGATYYHAVTYDVPYYGDTLYGLIHQHMSAPVPAPQAKNPAVSDDVAAIIRKAMAKAPEDRYQSCEEMIADLERVLPSERTEVQALVTLPDAATVVAPRPTPPPRYGAGQRATRAWFHDVAILACMVAGIAVLWFLLSGRKAKPAAPAEKTTAETAPERAATEKSAHPSEKRSRTTEKRTRADEKRSEPDAKGPSRLSRKTTYPLPTLPPLKRGIEVVSSDWGEWQEIFNGRDLDGWKAESGDWKVEGGGIVASGAANTPKKIACAREFSGSGIVLEYAARGTGSLNAWITVDGREVVFRWGDAPDNGPATAMMEIDGKRGEATAMKIDPARTYRVQVRLDGDWAAYGIDHNKVGPEPFSLGREKHVFRVGLATESDGTRYEKPRVKVLRLSEEVK